MSPLRTDPALPLPALPCRRYDKDNISEKKVARATPLLQDPRLEPEVIRKASTAAYGLSCWVRAMVEYYHVSKVVVPKKIKLKASQAECVALALVAADHGLH